MWLLEKKFLLEYFKLQYGSKIKFLLDNAVLKLTRVPLLEEPISHLKI